MLWFPISGCCNSVICNKVLTLYPCSLQAVRIMHCVLRKYGSYESFEVATGGNVLPKCQVWASVRKYLQKEGCVGEVRSACQHNCMALESVP